MDTLGRLKASMNDLKEREANAYHQVKQSVTMVEQAQLEKTEVRCMFLSSYCNHLFYSKII